MGINDFGAIAWHEDGRWNVSQLSNPDDMSGVMDQLKAQNTNGGALALIAIDDEFFVIARALGSKMQLMISDVTYANDYDIATDLLDILDLPSPEEEDDSQPGGDIDLLSDLGVNAMELEAIAADENMFPDEAIEAIAWRLGFGEEFTEVFN